MNFVYGLFTKIIATFSNNFYSIAFTIFLNISLLIIKLFGSKLLYPQYLLNKKNYTNIYELLNIFLLNLGFETS